MKYTLEIQKLLLQAQNDNLHPREKANLLREAIRIADENEEIGSYLRAKSPFG